MPKIRDHFSSFISNDKLFIIGGMGAFRKDVIDVFYFDLKTRTYYHLLCSYLKNNVANIFFFKYLMFKLNGLAKKQTLQMCV